MGKWYDYDWTACGGGSNQYKLQDASKLLSGDFSKKYDYESQSREEIKIFLNLVVRDKIEICFYISCFKTNLVFQHLEFDLSHLEKGTRNKKLIFEVEQEFSREFWDQDRIRSHWRQNNFSERIMFKPSIRGVPKMPILQCENGRKSTKF